MKNHRRSQLLTTGVVLSALAATAAGCGGDSAGSEDASGDSSDYSVALSVAFTGNAWRKSMIQGWEYAAKQAKAAGDISDYKVSVAPQGTATSQIAQIQSLILEQPDAINIDAESPTALNPVIKQACDAGIEVIVFDQTTDATDDCSTFLYNPLKDYGAAIADSVATQIGGAGNVILVEGVVGGKPNAEILSGVEEVLEEYPDVEIVSSVVGESSDSVTEKALTGVLPTLDDVDGVISWGGTSGILSAFAKADRPVPALVFDNSGESLRKLAELFEEDPDFQGSGVFTDPGQGAAAFQATMLKKDGTELPKEIITPVITIPQKDLDAWIDVTGPGAVAQWLWTEDDISQVIETQGTDSLFEPAIPDESL
ncbi:MAG: ABC transporter substrate-binding protein [Nocardioides sp.]